MISHHLSIEFPKKISSRLAKKWLSYGQKTYAHIWNNWYFKGNFDPKLGQISIFFNEIRFIQKLLPYYIFSASLILDYLQIGFCGKETSEKPENCIYLGSLFF